MTPWTSFRVKFAFPAGCIFVFDRTRIVIDERLGAKHVDVPLPLLSSICRFLSVIEVWPEKILREAVVYTFA